MSSNSVGLPNSFDRFGAIWHIDFEFRPDPNHYPMPVTLFAKERRTGVEISMRRPELLACTRPPFDTGSDALVVGYSIVAELSCFAMLRWPPPSNVLCTYVETS